MIDSRRFITATLSSFILVLLCCGSTLSAQHHETLILHDSLSTENGIELSQLGVWKYKAGDDPSWASPDYDDSDWLTFDSPEEIPDSLASQIGWLRYHIAIDTSLKAQSYFLNVRSWGKVKVFFNGEKLSGFGPAATESDFQTTRRGKRRMDTSAPIQLTSGTQGVLAFHYEQADQLLFGALYTNTESNPIQLEATIVTDEYVRKSNTLNELDVISMSIANVILLLVLVLHIAMFVTFPEEKGNFWIALLTLSLLAIGLYVWVDSMGFLSRYGYAVILFFLPLVVSLPISLIPATLGRVLDVTFDKRWFYVPIPVLLVFPIISKFSLYYQFELMVAFAALISIVGAIKIYGQGRKEGKRDIGILVVSMFSYPLLFLSLNFFLNFSNTNDGLIYTIGQIFILTTMPLGFSIYHMRRFFRSHGNLQKEVALQTADLQQALEKLKASQDQLIQQEKLASLGQLTAGIAHEIKNPLNFVNNFSELSIDLIQEALEEIARIEENEHAQETADILADVKSNLSKIHSHGTRANSIVNSMLMHSRASGGEMKPTDFNAVVKEFVGLSFHGMRAGKQPINVDIQYHLDESIGEVSLITEDFSRVILNLSNNAFDAMRERLVAVSRRQSAIGEQPSMYHPTLSVRTKKQGNSVMLEIQDNGPGIPDEIKDKILQPFFTTKKGTEGTGLGLSITNDIVKAHGGKLEIISEPGKTNFIISLERS